MNIYINLSTNIILSNTYIQDTYLPEVAPLLVPMIVNLSDPSNGIILSVLE